MPKQHSSPAVKKLLKQIQKQGFCVEPRPNGVRIIPPNGGDVYFTHATESCIHPLKRDFRKLYGVSL